MIYKNAELYNVEEIVNNDCGGMNFLRVPKAIFENVESGEQGKKMIMGSTGVEIRFVLKGQKAIIKMSATPDGRFHVFRGGMQGTWIDSEHHKIIGTELETFEIEKLDNFDDFKKIHDKCNYGWDGEVVRVIFDGGIINLYDIIGDIEPPLPSQCPQKTLLCYGSSITHGSNSLSMSDTWASFVGHNLGMDVRNLGMAGSCFIEKDFIDYIASEGEKNKWDISVLELGVNVLDWDKEKFKARATYAVSEIAKRNHDKKIYVISPMYIGEEDLKKDSNAPIFRKIIKAVVNESGFKNVTYINGLDLLGDCTGISADLVHPNIFGVHKIAEKLTEIIKGDYYGIC